MDLLFFRGPVLSFSRNGATCMEWKVGELTDHSEDLQRLRLRLNGIALPAPLGATEWFVNTDTGGS